MTTQIYFVRHGQPHNPQEILYGRLPRIRLTAEGRQQAREAGQKLLAEDISAIYSSPLLRTRQTALEIAGQLQLENIRYSRDLIEVGSHFQGTPYAELIKTNWDIFSDEVLAEGDETLAGILARLQRFCRLANRRHPGEKIVAVSHGDPIMLMRAHALRLPLELSSIRASEGRPYVNYTEIVPVLVRGGEILAAQNY